MKKSILATFAAALLAANAFAQEAAPAVEADAAPEQPVLTMESLLAFIPEDVATSNGETLVTRKEIVDIMAPQLEFALMPENRGKINVTPEIIQNYVFSIAQRLSNLAVIKKAAFAAGIKADAEEIDAQLKAIKEQVGSEEKFNQILAQNNLNEALLREQIGEEMVLGKFQESFLPKDLVISDEDVAAFYAANKEQFVTPELLSASHILVAFPGESPTDEQKAECLAKITKIKERLDAGEDFAEVAKAESDCPSKENGGDLGQFQKGQMVKEFEYALLQLKEGEISAPVETIFGYHLIKAGAHTEAETHSLEEVKEDISKYLLQQKQMEAVGLAMNEIIQKANIKMNLPLPKGYEDEDDEDEEDDDDDYSDDSADDTEKTEE